MPDDQPTSLFRVALTADFFDQNGAPKYREMGLDVLDSCVAIKRFSLEKLEPKVLSSQLYGANGVIVLTPAVTAETVSRASRLLAIGRFGVGYDAVDVAACTEADVAVFITAGAVDRSVAEATVAWMLALTHHLRMKDRLVREGGWANRSNFMGCELRDRVFGTIGFGGIARATIDLLRGFGMAQPLAFDPFVDPKTAQKYGVRLVDFKELLSQSDFVSVHCPLTPETRGLIGRDELGYMKSTAYLINTARGGIVDEAALGEALEQNHIAGAALDCFSVEPLTAPHPLSHLDNILFAPHCIAWTDELFRDIGQMVCRGMVDLAEGRRPHGVVNPEVFNRPGFIAKWERLRSHSNDGAVLT
jgi:phosphoglycerate dehydrogenase-like enzyme